jgi:hypothetical protein
MREMETEALMRSFGSEPKRALGFGGYPTEETLGKYGPAFRAFCEQMRTRGHWHDDITEDEAEALIAERRKEPGMTASDINAQERRGGFCGHDCINRWILIKRRCERLGVPVHCPACEGHGYIHTEPGAHVSLTLWWLHPRKGCSRGIEVERLQQSELPAVFDFLREAAERNAQRFSKLPGAAV